MCVPGVIGLLLSTSFYLVGSCPSSCAICSEEATVCQGLPYITAVPSGTKELIVTDGNISSIGINNFSYLLNLTLLRLSGNKIQQIQDGAFTNLTQLRTLVLDNNQISAASISNKTFLPLPNLKTLQLNNNYFGSLNGTWFKSTKHLIKLEINRNQITNLTHHSFGPNAFHCLEHLDLSSNFISFIHEETFLGLQHLRELDLSKNRLTKLPGVFSLLSHLSLLNLGQNHWNCTCELHQLADFLRNYTYSAERILKTGNGLRCSYSSNPGVKSLLQLTERNCLSKTYNITAASKERDRGYFREGILISILVLTGIIAVLFIIIIIAKCNLQPNNPSAQGSTRCCCGETQDFPGIRSHLPKVPLTPESNRNVMSFVDPAKNRNPFMKKHTGSLHLGYNPGGSDKSLRASGKENLPGSYYICINCRLVQWLPPSPSAMFVSDEVGCISNSIQRISANPKDCVQAAPWVGANTTVLQELSRFNKGETSIRRSFFPKDDMTAVRSIHSPDPCDSISGSEQRKIASYKQSADVMSRLTTKGSVEMKTHAGRPPLHPHRSQKGGPGVLRDERTDISLPTDNDLICKYMECDKLEEPRRQITEPGKQNVKFEEQKIQTRVSEENCFLNNDSTVLSARIRQVNIPRNVGFYIPHIQPETDMAVNTSQSRQEQFFRPHLGSKYLRTINNKDCEGRQTSCTDTLVDSLKDIYIHDKVCYTKYTRKTQDYLRVKVNLQPFRKIRVHPQQNTGVGAEPTKRGHSPKKVPPQLPRKKLKGNKSTSSYTTRKATSQTSTKHNKPNHVDDSVMVGTSVADCPVSKNKNALDKKSKGKTSGRAALPEGYAYNTTAKETYTTLKEKDNNISCLQTGPAEGRTPNISAEQCSGAFSKDELLNSAVDRKRNESIEQSPGHAEPKDLETQGWREELTESKLQTQCGSRDNACTLSGNVLDTKLSNVTGICGGTDSLSCGNNAVCEIDIAGSSLPGNKVNGHLEGNIKDDITEVGHLLSADNSIKHKVINGAKESGIKASRDGSLADSVEGKAELLEGCEKENISLETNEKKDINDKSSAAINSQSSPGRTEPSTCGNIDDPVSTNEHVHPDDNELLMQGPQDNKHDEINTSQKQIRESTFIGGDPSPVSDQLPQTHPGVQNETLLTDRQNNESSNSALKTSELAATAERAHTSAASPQPNEQNNSNNNHSKPPAETGRKHLSLSESSKVIIVVESLNKTVNIQKYLTERSTSYQSWQNTNPPSNESDSTSGDGRQRKKICLILPEKSDSGGPKLTSKKIK